VWPLAAGAAIAYSAVYPHFSSRKGKCGNGHVCGELKRFSSSDETDQDEPQPQKFLLIITIRIDI